MGQIQTVGRVATTVAHDYDQGETVVTYHNTQVVKFDHRRVTLDSGGYMTATTKTRMNQAANQFNLGYRVYQKNYAWFVKLDNDPLPWTFYDKMVLDYR